MALALYSFWAVVSAAWVWLALGPLDATTPEWVRQTREVCFGSLDNGLPDVHGWISLTAPLPMLLALLILMGRDLRRQFLSLSRTLSGFLVAVTLLLLPCWSLAYAGLRMAQAPQLPSPPELGALPADYPVLDESIPDFELVNQRGEKVRPSQLKGQATLLSFVYGHCQTVCPMLLTNLRWVARSRECRLVLVTLDPRRDTCGTLEGLLHYWDLPENTWMLGGEVSDIEAVLSRFQVSLSRDPSTGEIAHPALVLVLDGRARLRYRLNNPSRQWLQDALERASLR